MRDPKQVGSKPRPWSLPRLQRAIGNQALDRLINPPAPPTVQRSDEEPSAPSVSPPPSEPAGAARAWLPWLLSLVGAAAGSGLGYLAELTTAAPYAGPALGAAFGFVLLWRMMSARDR